MALRNNIIAGTAALGMAFASVAPAMAQDATPATFIETPTYTAISEAQNDPAFSDGVVFQTDGRFAAADSVAVVLREEGLNAAVIHGGLDDSMIRVYLDGRTNDKLYFSEQDFLENSGTIMHRLTLWNAGKIRARENAALSVPSVDNG
ncbi:hypothetical protein JQU17_22140 [Ponticoccus sp. SC2-23]|uniref:hypothetical protein n=1 Tax=Alexandriicola marinus TaxID=2081710 RepID=UPI000FD93838|nr:hypothetical protein [Alexandriicola marinus]MBM1222934.1 hypothetical protein [Ponticoccus sp. SC6-9]MBM1227333.1 hypothetical protein [Ponticoccus sp. SC6-15]MBM1231836.1 hypothetical protein [Ponticoccus sp. SC6-38]MBM1236366.1 hypothetical protein [Ponticoccus sp. SC6-45]MBM1240882.1 hypothetical protein [Ponticoccus sp. SC6-49]MBM1245408.1 hypothetical protein [Ponticoccus sp. SC2-64]MBM1249840.1 hypothetical protein [Ponticoccus sp. SC6-42]MBM1254370.1 hypothetical protein [Pontico